MIEVVALCLAWLAGVDPWRLGLLAAAAFVPLVIVPLVAVAAIGGRRSVDDRAVVFCEGVAAELRSGSTLIHALASVGESLGLESFSERSGRPPSLVVLVEGLEREFPDLGVELGATVRGSARSGGAAADLFDEIGSLAIAGNEIAREVRVSTAAARATAWLLAVAPLGYLIMQTRSGGIGSLLQVPEQRVAVVAGLCLFGLGLAAVFALMWRAR